MQVVPSRKRLGSRRERIFKRTADLALALVIFGLAGCGSSQETSLTETPPPASVPRVNALRVLDPTPDSRFQDAGDPVEHVAARGFDSAGKLVYGPVDEVYDEDMLFSGLPDSARRVELDYNRGRGYTLARHTETVDFAKDDDGVVTLNQVAPLALGADRRSFTVRIENGSAYPDDQVFVSVNGKNKEANAFYYVEFGPNDTNTARPFRGLADSASYSQQLTLLKKEGDHAYSFQCPYEDLVSGRIYLSFGKKLQGLGLNDPSQPMSLQLPSATGAPDAQTLYEFMELSATLPTDAGAPQNYTLYANTSVVDYFSIGLGMTLDYHDGGKNSAQTVGFIQGARDLVLAEFAKSSTPTEFKNYVLKDGSQTVLRVLAPTQKIALDPNGSLAHFLDPAIDSGWAYYAGVALDISDNLPSHTYGYKYVGTPIVNAVLSMTCTQKPSGDVAGGVLESLGEVCHLPKPTSRIVFLCDDNQSPPLAAPDKDTWRNAGSDGHKRLVSLLGAALNRGVLENYADWGDSSKFYARPDGKYNHYSKIMHKFALDKKVYGFGYDDVYGQDPTLVRALDEVNQIVIKIPSVPQL